MKSRKGTKRALMVAVLAAIGTTGIGMNTASATNLIPNGAYNLVINTTPTGGTGNYTHIIAGADGTWNSSFTFGGAAPTGNSQGMTDNDTLVNGHGSGIAGDGYAGILGIDVTGGTFTVYGAPTMNGTIDQTTGAMTLNPTGRLGTVSGYPTLVNEAWNIDNCTLTTAGCTLNSNTAYQTFSTVSASTETPTSNGVTTVTIHGAAFTSTGSGNFGGILVSGGQVGNAWGGFFGEGYLEAWNVDLLKVTTPHSGFNVDTIYGTTGGNFAEYPAPVPIPAAAWLFGSGLIGLVGIARRKKSKKSS